MTEQHIEIEIINRPERRKFDDIVRDIKRFGGTFDANTRTWVIGSDHREIRMLVEQAISHNERFPEHAAWPTDVVGIIKDRFGKYVALTLRTIDPALDMANIDKSWSAL